MTRPVGKRPEKQREYLDLINSVQNFFKHSSRDATVELEFNPDVTTYLLWDAIRMYLALVKERPCVMLAFTTWFYLRHLDLISNDGSIPTQFVGDTLNPDDSKNQ